MSKRTLTKSEEKKSRTLFFQVAGLVNEIGCIRAAKKLGYRSPSFFCKWKKNELVPSIAIEKVSKKLSKIKA